MKRSLILLLTTLITVLSASAVADTVRVSADASLAESFREIGGIFEKKHPGSKVEFNFADSQLLRTQIEQGNSADVFASADLTQMKVLAEARKVQPQQVFAHNRLGVVTPKGKTKVLKLMDLAKPGVKILSAGPKVPVGAYTHDVLELMVSTRAFGPALVKKVQANMTNQETSVQGVLSKIAKGEFDAGFVYATDATTAKAKVNTIPIPATVNVSTVYSIAPTAQTRALLDTAFFIAEVMGPQGQAVLRKHGFQK